LIWGSFILFSKIARGIWFSCNSNNYNFFLSCCPPFQTSLKTFWKNAL
jgi:hypothetical protein